MLVLTCLNFVASAQLSGSYTIGGTSPDYTTIANAVSALQSSGVSGPVTFNLRNGVYNEQIVLSGWTGASSTNLVTFQSESGDSTAVAWEYWGSSNTTIPITINGADHVKFNKLWIRSTLSGNHRKCVRIITGVSNVSFNNCFFRGAQYANNEDENIVEVFLGFGVDFDKCRFTFGHNAIKIVDSFNGTRNNHSFITNCEFYNFRENAIFAQYFADITIEDNFLFSDATRGVTGIEFEDGTGLISVRRNRMDLNVTPTGIGGNRGIICGQSKFVSGSIIANNMIHLKGRGTGAGGIRLNSNTTDTCWLDFAFNTVRLEGNVGFDYPVVFGGTHGTRILNNILSSSITDNIIVSQNADSIDYNIFYSDGLVDWTQTVNYLGPNNFSLDPLYLSASDLHVVPTLSSNGGSFMPSVTLDIDGDARDPLTPDIGADEIATAPTDAMISNILSPKSDSSYCGVVDNIEVVLSNIGSNTLTSCNVILEINGGVVNTLNWTGNLATGDSDTLDLGSFPYVNGVAYEFVVYTSMPNGAIDQMQLNDTVVLSNFHTGLAGTYTLGGTSPDFSSFTALQLALDKGGMCGPVVVNVRDGIYIERLLLDDIVGSSEINTLTIQGESGDSSLVELRGEYSPSIDYTLRIDDMRFVTIKHMRIRNTGAINNKVLRLLRVSDITLESLIVQGYSCSGCSSQTTHGLYASLVDSNLVIDKVRGQTAGTSLLLFGNDNLGSDSRNFTITNSLFGKFEIYDCHNLYIADNTMGGGFSDFDDCGYFFIERNHFTSALAFWSSGAAGPSSVFKNNTMDAWETIGFSNTWDWALYLPGTGNVDIIHNTFKSRDVARSIFFSSSGADVYNNIFYRDNGLSTITTVPFTLQTSAVVVNSDYNVFWVENPIGSDPLGYIQTNYGLDSNSIQIDPSFSTHADSLFWPTNSLVDNFGTDVWSLAVDFYGTPRPPQSDAGAIEQPFLPNANLGVDTIVCGQIQLGWVNQGYDYAWNTGDTTSSILVDTSGTYILTVTNAQGVDADTVNVTVSAAPNVSLADTVWHCFGDSIALEVNQAGLTFNWSNGDTDSVAVFAGTQLASVQLTNSSGCDQNVDVEIVELDSISLSLSVMDEQCLGQNNGGITAQVLNANQPIDFTWAHTANMNDTLENLSPGTYYLAITDASGCMVEDSAIIAQGNNYPDINLNDSTYHCFGVPAVLDVFQPGLTYEWSNSATSSSISILGDQSVNVVATNSFGCTDTTETLVLSYPEIVYTSSSSDESCFGVNDGSATLSITAGINPIVISWSSVGSDSTIVEDLAPGTYVYSLTDSASCQIQDSVTILPGVDLAASISSPVLGCENTNVLFNGSSSGTIQDWYVDGVYNSTGIDLNQSFAIQGTYTIKMIASDGVCLDSTETQVNIGGPSSSTFSHITCAGSYTWIDGNTYTSSNSTATHVVPNVYGCDSIITLNLTINSSSSSIDQVSACESFTWIDGNTYTSSNTTAQWTIPNSVGCDSVVSLNLTILQNSVGTDVITACDSYVWIDGNTYTSNNSTATHILPNAQGCDSIVTLNLTINTVSTSVVENDPELYGPPLADTYQWVDCDNGYAPLVGDTFNLFTATANGNYAVIVEQNGCIDTSDCFMINRVNVSELEMTNWSLSPNPTESFVNIQFDQPTDAEIEVLNALGQLISTFKTVKANEAQIELGSESGMYFIRIHSSGIKSTVPVIKM
ncbi:MAG: T9SS type A sorting domain-containing protein [Crocinitomicaceae bacterium]